jgi:hypothetical protein
VVLKKMTFEKISGKKETYKLCTRACKKLAKTLSAFSRKHELVQHSTESRIERLAFPSVSGHGLELDIALAILVGIFSLPMVITTCPRGFWAGEEGEVLIQK